MAGDWIKLEVTTPDKPEVFVIAEILKIDPDAALGKLVRLWSWFDQHLENGNDASVTESLINRIAGQPGFCSALQQVGWIMQTPLGYDIIHFERHNGKTAKTRALTAKRVAAFKDKSNDGGNEELTPSSLPREEKRREELKETTIVGGKVVDLLPSNIPYKEIVGFHNEHMGKLPMVREMTKKRRDLIRGAWNAGKHRQTLKFWKAYFEECADDDFLNGNGPYGKGHENWRPTFDYLMRNDVITRVYEKAMSHES